MVSQTQLPALIIGSGLAGPSLALLLRRQSIPCIVFERAERLNEEGATIMLMPNGLRCLRLCSSDSPSHGPVCGENSAAQILLQNARPPLQAEERTMDGEVLGSTDVLGTFEKRYGFPMAGVKRTEAVDLLRKLVEEGGGEVRMGWEFLGYKEEEDGIIARFKVKGREEEVKGGWLVGADGIRSRVRRCVLDGRGVQEGGAVFTGLVQTAFISPTPPSLLLDQKPPSFTNYYGPAIHALSYPISNAHTSWVITSPYTPSSSSEEAAWGLRTGSAFTSTKSDIIARAEKEGWAETLVQLAKGIERVIEYGLFDREGLEAENWVSEGGRVVLVGDAAHPTSVHLGQGANQALEDTLHLSHLFSLHKGPFTTSSLSQIFNSFATSRQPWTAALVKGARANGERRVVQGGKEACEQRDDEIREMYRTEEGGFWGKRYDQIFEKSSKLVAG